MKVISSSSVSRFFIFHFYFLNQESFISGFSNGRVMKSPDKLSRLLSHSYCHGSYSNGSKSLQKAAAF